MDATYSGAIHGRDRSDAPLYTDSLLVFIVLTVLYLVIGMIANEHVFTDDLWKQSLGDHLAADQMDILLLFREKKHFLGYLLFPLILFLKVGYTAVCLSVGATLTGYKTDSLKAMLNIALLCEGVFLVAAAVRLVTSLWLVELQTVDEFAMVASLSVYSWLGAEAYEPWLHYPLRTLNLYEALYCIAMAVVLARRGEWGFQDTILLVLVSYGSGLVLWMASVAFVTLQLS